MTNHPRLEVPFDEVEKWEKIEGSCARFYAAAEWGYKKGLKEQRSIIIRELVDQVVPEQGCPIYSLTERENERQQVRSQLLAIVTELEGQ